VSWETINGLYSEADATTYLATQAGFTYPTTTTGFVAVSVFGAGSSDHPAATATISPAVGSGPVYTDALGTPDPTLTSGGRFLFGNLPPGTYTITVQSPGRTCSEQDGGFTINGQWPPTATGTLPVGITANALTVGLVVACT
jgi:hypothetical protein